MDKMKDNQSKNQLNFDKVEMKFERVNDRL